MAYSTVETKVVNPARKRSNVAKTKKRRNLSAKQIRAGFGGKRRKTAAKRRHAPARRNPPKGGGRVISGYGSTVMNPHRRKRNPGGSHKIVINSARKRKRRTNVGEIIALTMGNSARKRGSMAKSRKRKNPARRRRTMSAAPRRRRVVKMNRARHRRRNPGMIGRPMDWIKGGVAVLGGVVVTRALPQAVAASYNTSYTGYAMNAVTAVAATWATHALTKDAVLTAAVAAGGFAALIARIINDMTPYGSYLSLTGIAGMGDYQFSNFVAPQRITNQRQAVMQVPQGWNGSALPTGNYQDSLLMGADVRGGDY